MSEFNQEFNYHDSKIRNIIVSVLAKLQDKISFKQVLQNNEYKIIVVPFYFSQTGSEDFLTDYFINDDISKYSNVPTDGAVNRVPRGVINLTSIDIDTGSMTNRYVRTMIPKKVDETTFKMYSYETMILPINLSFDATIVSNSTIEMFKLTESLMSVLYKATPFYTDFGGYRVRGYINVPENFQHERLFEFSFSDKKQHDITFQIDVNTSFPIFDESSEMFAGNVMNNINLGVFDISSDPNNSGLYANQNFNTDANKKDFLK